MPGFLKQSTASQTVQIGPYIDDTDFKTLKTGLTIANTDIKLSKAGGSQASKNSGGGTHDALGMYAITLDATDTNTVGKLQLISSVAGALVVWDTFTVVEEAVYDALFASGAAGYASQASVDDLPTNAELATALGTADDATLSAIAALTIPTAVQNADALLGRSIVGGANGGRMVKDALKALRNRVGIAAGTMTVYEADDSTPAWTAAVTTTAGDPLSEIDPA